MKFKLFLLVLSVFIIGSCSAQIGIFGPKPVPYPGGKFGLTADSTHNFFRPTVSVSATFSNGTSLAGGFGIQFQHDKADAASNTWVIQYSVSAIGFLTTNGSKLGGVGGIVLGIPGTNGIVNVGGGRDFTNGAWVFITGASINL